MFRIPLPMGDSAVLASRYREFAENLEKPLHDTQHLIEKVLEKYGLSPTIYSRIKQFPSLYEKVLKKLRTLRESPREVVVLTDILGIRIICPFLEDVDRAISILSDEFTISEVDRKGEELTSLQFGYNTTHLQLVVPETIRKQYKIEEEITCEIQVRTILQEAWSAVEHEIIYKTDFTPFGEPLERKLSALNATLTLSDIIFQEIRDYQRGLQEELSKRRNSFQEDIQRKSGDITQYLNQDQKPAVPSFPEKIVAGADSVDYLLLKALKEHNAGRFDEAEILYTEILKKVNNPRVCSIILIHRGMAEFARMDYPRALEDFTLAGTEDNSNAKAWYLRGIVYRVLDQSGQALEDLTRSIVMDSYQTDPLIARARLLYHSGDLPGALKDCRKALELSSALVEARDLHNLIVQKLHGESPEMPKNETQTDENPPGAGYP